MDSEQNKLNDEFKEVQIAMEKQLLKKFNVHEEDKDLLDFYEIEPKLNEKDTQKGEDMNGSVVFSVDPITLKRIEDQPVEYKTPFDSSSPERNNSSSKKKNIDDSD